MMGQASRPHRKAPEVLVVGAVCVAAIGLWLPTARASSHPSGTRPAGEAVRHFRMGFTPFPHDFSLEGIVEVQRFLADNADLIAHHFENVPWTEALHDEPFHPKMMEDWDWNQQNVPPGGKVLLALTPIRQGAPGLAPYRGEEKGLPLPEPFDRAKFDDPIVADAYINYCRRAVEYFRPDYLCIGMEVNELFQKAPGQWDAYRKLHSRTYRALKRDYPDLPVFVSLTLHSLFEHDWRNRKDLLRAAKDLLKQSDRIGVSFYPFFGGHAGRIDEALAWLVRSFADVDKPFAFCEMGQTAEPLRLAMFGVTFDGSPQLQADVLASVIGFADQHPTEFLVWLVPRDYDALWDRIRGGVPEVVKVFKDCGLLDEAGQPRPAYRIWSMHLQRPWQPVAPHRRSGRP